MEKQTEEMRGGETVMKGREKVVGGEGGREGGK